MSICAEEIQGAAILCKHCGRVLPALGADALATITEVDKPKTIWPVIVFVIGLIIVAWVITPSSPAVTPNASQFPFFTSCSRRNPVRLKLPPVPGRLPRIGAREAFSQW